MYYRRNEVVSRVNSVEASGGDSNICKLFLNCFEGGRSVVSRDEIYDVISGLWGGDAETLLRIARMFGIDPRV